MRLQPTPLTQNQVVKIGKALAFSFVSAFATGVLLSLANVISAYQSAGVIEITPALFTGLLLGGVTSGINTLAVTIQQVFKDESNG